MNCSFSACTIVGPWQKWLSLLSIWNPNPQPQAHWYGWQTGQKNKRPEYYNSLKEKYKDFISDNELSAMPSVMEAVTTRTMSLLKTDVKSRKLIRVSRDVMKETLKSLNIGAKILARQTNTMCDILLAT